MRKILFLLLFCWGCDGANREAKEMIRDAGNQLVQTKKANGFIYRLAYLPQGIQPDEMNFRLTVQLPQELKGGFVERKELSYGLDTLFSFVSGQDTIPSLHTIRVANGNIGGLEYMIVFPRIPNGQNSRMVFSDWLFSNMYLEFPVKIPAILKIDSLSARI